MAVGMMASQSQRGGTPREGVRVMKKMRVYVGTYTDPILFGTGEIFQGKGKGIYCYDLDPSTGQLAHTGTTTGVTNPSYLALDPAQRFLYAVNELKTFEDEPTGTLSSFSVDSATGELTFINKKPTGGTDPCHVILSRDGRLVVRGQLHERQRVRLLRGPGRQPGKGERLRPARRVERGPEAAERPACPLHRARFHRHALPWCRTSAWTRSWCTGSTRSTASWSPPAIPGRRRRPGAGPRHVAFHPSGRFVYLINELDCTIAVYSFNPKTAEMKELQIVPTLPAGYSGPSSCADLQIAPSGAWLYGSNRGHDSIVIYRVDGQTGKLEYVGHEPTQGRNPRSFGIDPTGTFLIAANQSSSNLVPFRLNGKTGGLEATGQSSTCRRPVCVKIITP